jgi:hypothetical protein
VPDQVTSTRVAWIGPGRPTENTSFFGKIESHKYVLPRCELRVSGCALCVC